MNPYKNGYSSRKGTMRVVVYWNKIGYADLVKDIVYRTEIRDINDLKQKITDAIATIDDAMLQQTWQEIEYHLDVLRSTNGAHVEVY